MICLIPLLIVFLTNIREQAGGAKCPLDPYFIMPDKCECVDFQILKLQELPDAVPQGEMPRHMQLFCDRYLCEKVVPGNRLTILGIYSIKKLGKASKVSFAPFLTFIFSIPGEEMIAQAIFVNL